MKKLLLAGLMLVAVGSAQAQYLRAGVAGGVAVGGIGIGASTGLRVGFHSGGFYPYRSYGYPGYGYYGYHRPYWGGYRGYGYGYGPGLGFGLGLGLSLGFGGPAYSSYYDSAPAYYAASPAPVATQQP